MPKISLLLADDHTVLRSGLRTLLENEPDIEVVGEAGDGDEAVTRTANLKPDVVIMDITMPGLSGIEATREIKRSMPGIKVLALTVHEDDSYLYQVMNAGADGYLTKKAADTELLAAIRATHRGEHYIHSSMTESLLARLRGQQVRIAKNETQDAIGLSPRETEVLRLLATGHTNQQIADTLFLSVKTVETYKARLKDKLGIKGRAELVRYAISRDLLKTEP